MSTYIFTKEAEGFSIATNGAIPEGFINAFIAKSETPTTLAVRIGDDVQVFRPAIDTIIINGDTFSGTPAELWTELTEQIFDEQQGGGEIPANMAVTDGDNDFSVPQTFRKQVSVDSATGVVTNAVVFGASGSGYGGVGYNVLFQEDNFAYKYANGFSDYANMIFFESGGFILRKAVQGTTGGDITWVDVLKVNYDGSVQYMVDPPEYADNAAAVAASLAVGKHYRTGDLLKIVHP